MRDESGFTLAEVLVGMSLSFLVAGLVFSCYLFAARQVQTWRQDLNTASLLHLALRRVSEDLYRADTVVAYPPNAYTIYLPGGDSISYRLDENVLTRNRHPVHGSGLSFATVRLTPETSPGAKRLYVRIRLDVADGRHTRSANTAVLLRRSAGWCPVAIITPLVQDSEREGILDR